MAVDLSQLNNISDFNLDTSLLDGDIKENIKENAIETTEGWFGFAIMLSIFLFMVWHNYRKDGFVATDILRSGTVSSGFVTILGLIMAWFGFIGSYKIVVWYGVIFMTFLISLITFKRKGF